MALEPRPAGVVLRAVALFLDLLIVGFPLAIVVGLIAGQTYSGDGQAGIELHGAAVWVWAGLVLVYLTAAEATTGVTLGKRLVHVRVTKDDGSPIGIGDALIRNIARIVDAFPYILPYLVGALVSFSDPRARRLGDKWAGTVVERD